MEFDVDDLQAADRVISSQINLTHRQIAQATKRLDLLKMKLERLEEFKNDITSTVKELESKEVELIEELKKKGSIGEAAIYLAQQFPDSTITAQYAKRMISDRAGLGTPGAIFAYFSRTDAFKTVDRGKYKLIPPTKLHAIPSPIRRNRLVC